MEEDAVTFEVSFIKSFVPFIDNLLDDPVSESRIKVKMLPRRLHDVLKDNFAGAGGGDP